MKPENMTANDAEIMEVKFEQRRRFLLVIPLLVIPFLTLGFKLLGGGKGNGQTGLTQQSGLNIDLPDANAPDKDMDKLAFYEQAKKDSLKHLEHLRNDPYYIPPVPDFENGMDIHAEADFGAYDDYRRYVEDQDKNERMVYERLDKLNAALESAQLSEAYSPAQIRMSEKMEYDGLKSDIDRLEYMMEMMQGEGKEPDPEMQQISQTLETILDIQHPERVQDRLKRSSEERLGEVFAVEHSKEDVPITMIENPYLSADDPKSGYSQQKDNRFFGLDDHSGDVVLYNGIAAVVHESQTLVSGSTVKLRLTDDIYLNGVHIPKDNFIYGIAKLSGERLEIDIENIRFANSLFPVKLSVYDLDGIAGIRIPGAISRDVAKQSGDQALQSLNMGIYAPNLGLQAANAGIELGKNLLSKKIKLIKVEVKAGYQVLLRDGKKRE